jgi:purine-binding chemotaxis protein CheW
MSAAMARITERAVEMRREFDRAFATPVQFDQVLQESMLAIGAGGRNCAIRFTEIAGLHADKKITPVPGAHAALRGIAGFRGAILPVYDLAAALGFPVTQAPRWLVIVKAAPVALAFESFERQLRVAPEAVLRQSVNTELRGCTRAFLRTAEFSGPIIHLPSVLAAVNAAKPGMQ